MSANRDLTRRQWAVALTAAAAVPAPAPAQSGPSPEQMLEQARGGVRATRDALKRFRLPMDTEPAMLFRA